MKKATAIFFDAVPILIMIALIPLVTDDYLLTIIDVAVICIFLATKNIKNELPSFVFGFLAMVFFEYFFVSTGVETFQRNTLFGVMPLWLPFLWGYGFVAMRRALKILDM